MPTPKQGPALPGSHPENDTTAAPSADSPVARAIDRMERDLAAPWTVPLLARAACVSRATLARRFVEETGESPIEYLTRLRMERAAELLAETTERLADIAPRVGYDSEFTFGRAFRRHFGVAPGRFRTASPAPAGTRTRMAA